MLEKQLSPLFEKNRDAKASLQRKPLREYDARDSNLKLHQFYSKIVEICDARYVLVILQK